MKDCKATFKESFLVGDIVAMEEAATRIWEILEAKYEKANLREICDKSMHFETCRNSSVPLNLSNNSLLVLNCELSIFYLNYIKVPSH
jgi:hypothetical protein